MSWPSGGTGQAAHLEGGPLDSGHHMAEEAPEALADALTGFWKNAGATGP
ncbi:hypothetical protein M2161_004770 [Streptomyces sp. SAI-133]|nr:hypothetical protein [Streptomyces sp. SAI-133]